MNGYIKGQWDAGNQNRDELYHGFQRYVENRFNLKVSQGWDAIVCFMTCNEMEAFEKTKELWNAYKSEKHSQ